MTNLRPGEDGLDLFHPGLPGILPGEIDPRHFFLRGIFSQGTFQRPVEILDIPLQTDDAFQWRQLGQPGGDDREAGGQVLVSLDRVNGLGQGVDPVGDDSRGEGVKVAWQFLPGFRSEQMNIGPGSQFPDGFSDFSNQNKGPILSSVRQERQQFEIDRGADCPDKTDDGGGEGGDIFRRGTGRDRTRRQIRPVGDQVKTRIVSAVAVANDPGRGEDDIRSPQRLLPQPPENPVQS